MSEPIDPLNHFNTRIRELPAADQIQFLIDAETRGWDTKNPDIFLDMIHPDMVWPWPPTSRDHDPARWVFVLGRFNREEWRASWQELFDNFDLIHNRRDTVKIELTAKQDGAFAVVDIDTLWRHKKTGEESHWKGRVCKIYTKTAEGVRKFYFQTGALDFGGLVNWLSSCPEKGYFVPIESEGADSF